MTIWLMRIACWITKATHTHTHTHTHTQYVILIVFPLQQWLLERASMLRYTCIVCLVIKFGPIVRPVDDISTSYYVIFCRHEKRHGERAKFLVGVSLERNTLG
jgi:hypothetical protein